MLINKVPRLACRTQIARLLDGTDTVELKPYPAIEGGEQWNPREEVLVEPLPHLRVLKDLVVDMEKFFDFYRAVEPVLKPAGEIPEREYRMEQAAVKELEQIHQLHPLRSLPRGLPRQFQEPCLPGARGLGEALQVRHRHPGVRRRFPAASGR